MGFRSTVTSFDIIFPVPNWFVEKYKDCLYVHKGANGKKFMFPLASIVERKTYTPPLEDIAVDIQRLLKDSAIEMVVVWLHECGGITRVKIDKDKIIYSEPTGWEKTDGVTHDYCYGCSDLK